MCQSVDRTISRQDLGGVDLGGVSAGLGGGVGDTCQD